MLIPFWIIKLILVALGGYITFAGFVIYIQVGWAGNKSCIYIGAPMMLAGIAIILYGILS